MKCPKCWAEKAWIREVHGFKRVLLKSFCAVPLRCHHCYHKFHVSWFNTIGQQLDPPMPAADLRVYPPSADFSPQPTQPVSAASNMRRQVA